MLKKFMLCMILLPLTFFVYAQNAKPRYLMLPDGSSFPMKDGETTESAWSEAMRKYPQAFGLLRLREDEKMDLEWFNKCRSDAAKSAKSDSSLGQLLESCKYSAIPKKCRSHRVNIDSLGNESGEERKKCVKACEESNIYSKSIGECSKG